MVVISVASALILVRSLFRMIEYVEGRDGELQSKEVYLYALDAIPMAMVSIGFHVFHPSKYFNSRRKSLCESESEMTLGFPHIPRPGS